MVQRPPKIVFDEAVALSVKMPFARYIHPFTSKISIVQPVGTPLQPGNDYYGGHMKGHVHCMDCDIRVRIEGLDPAGARGNSLPDQTPHFRPYPGERHDKSCGYYTDSKNAKTKNVSIDKSRGFRLHLNVGEYHENTPDVLEPDLKTREAKIVRSAGDFYAFMMMYKINRVMDSVVVYLGKTYPLKDFFVSYNKRGVSQKSFIDFAEKLKAMPGKNPQLPCLMEMQIERPKVVDEYVRNRSVYTSRRVPYLRTDNGASEDIIPTAYIDRQSAAHDTGVSGAFNNGKSYLVLGMATLNKYVQGEGEDAFTTYYLNIKIHDPAQVVSVNIENIGLLADKAYKHPVQSSAEPPAIMP